MDIVEWAERHLIYKDEKGAPAPLRLFDYQKEYLSAFAEHKFTVICTPKRQGKTMMAAVAALWIAMNRDNSSVIILSTSQDHAAGVTFRRIVEIVKYTQGYYLKRREVDGVTDYWIEKYLAPAQGEWTSFRTLYAHFLQWCELNRLKAPAHGALGKALARQGFAKKGKNNTMYAVTIVAPPQVEHVATKDWLGFLKGIKVAQTAIKFPNNSIIEALPCTVGAIAGRSYDMLIIDELALIEDEEVANVAIAQSERESTKILITSTASHTEHLLYRLYLQSQEDPQIKFIYVSGERAALMNPLISERWLTQQKKTMPAGLFKVYFENEFGALDGGAVFNHDDILACIVPRRFSYQEALEHFKPEHVWVGIGIDRALPGSKHGDYSVGVTVLRFMDEHGTEFYLVLDVTIFATGEFDEIAGYIMDVVERCGGVDRIYAEDYQCADLYDWALKHGLSMELIHVTRDKKHKAFGEMQVLLKEKRLLIPSEFSELLSELKALQYAGGKFSAPTGRKDDCVYALLWAIQAAKDAGAPFFFYFIPAKR